jgi:hypothetical protein
MRYPLFAWTSLLACGCALGFAQRTEAAGANLHALKFALDHHVGGLDIGHPAARRVVLRVADVVPIAWLFAAYFTHCHILFLALLLSSALYERGLFSYISQNRQNIGALACRNVIANSGFGRTAIYLTT